MTIVLANKIAQIVETPTHCSACFRQDSSLRHVDLDAACDRGYASTDGITVAMDDLILCENCVREAAALIGMMDTDEFQGELESAKRTAERERKRALSAEEYAGHLELAMDKRPIPINHPRKAGRRRKDDEG